MTHTESQDLLLDLAYRELDPAHAGDLEAHLAGCAECQRDWAELEKTRRLVAPLGEEEEPPPGFDEAVLAAARAEASLQSDGTPGQVIEATGTVRPAGVEPAQIDATAVAQAPRVARRPRWALRIAIGGSAAAAAALALVGTRSMSRREPEPGTEQAYQIRIKTPEAERPRPAVANEAPTANARADQPAAAGSTAALPEAMRGPLPAPRLDGEVAGRPGSDGAPARVLEGSGGDAAPSQGAAPRASQGAAPRASQGAAPASEAAGSALAKSARAPGGAGTKVAREGAAPPAPESPPQSSAARSAVPAPAAPAGSAPATAPGSRPAVDERAQPAATAAQGPPARAANSPAAHTVSPPSNRTFHEDRSRVPPTHD